MKTIADFRLQIVYMTTELIAHAGRGGFETRPCRPTSTDMPVIDMRIF
jgi:hypothetical protein